ncbi:hypothetical protein BRC64_04370 [Halobacteriales archaeon QH_10_67_22]|nr:MAG: hypothetical protein BRC64_04370 [Halobacteriales archaeon QH_10_67_22]
MTDDEDPLYPNGDRDGPPVSRRRLLAGSAAVGAAATAGCGSDGETTPGVTEAPTVVVFNTGDRSVSVVDAERDEVVGTTPVGYASSFPSNQYAPELVDAGSEAFWGNVDGGVRAFGADDLSERARVETGSGFNWQERTPDGGTLVVSAREPAHTQYEIDADPDSTEFGSVLRELDRTDEGGRGDNDGPGPCDVTVHPDGRYAYVPDLFGDTLTVLDVDAFEIETQVAVDPVDGRPAQPWMGTASRDGETLLVEHRTGVETVWDVSDPAAPVERARLGPDDGMGEGALTSEVTDDGGRGFVFTPDTGDVTVIDAENGTVAERIDLGGAAFTGTWGPDRQSLYVPVQSADEVAVIDPEALAVTARLSVGAGPYGATAAGVRPDPEPARTEAALGALGLLDSGTTYCIGNCACGHDPSTNRM